MRPNNLTLCLYTTARGHFDRHDVYRQTVDGLLAQIPAASWGAMIAHVKHDGEEHAAGMVEWLKGRGFEVLETRGRFRHHDQSHQDQYLLDMGKVMGVVKTPYVLHAEDDWLFGAFDRPLEYWLHEAVSMLETDPDLMQVRIARFTDEAARINRLMAKHGIHASAEPGDDKAFRHSDYSANPSVFRTRDFRAALTFVRVSNLPKHAEHGVGPAFKILSASPLPFACLNPNRVRVAHIGVRSVEEKDDLSKPLLAD